MLAFDKPISRTEVEGRLGDLSPQLVQRGIRHIERAGLIEPTNGAGPPGAHPKTNRPRPVPTQSGDLTAWLHLTNDCNLHCDYCYVAKSRQVMSPETGQHAIRALIAAAVRHGFAGMRLKYAGGEPTLNFPLVLALHSQARRGAATAGLRLDGVVLSNGVALDIAKASALADQGLRASISLDGVGFYHDTQRKFPNGRGTFPQVAQALEHLRQVGVLHSVTLTVSQRNLAGLPASIHFLVEREIPFNINFFRPNRYTGRHPDLNYADIALIQAMQAAYAALQERLPRWRLLGALLDRVRLDSPHDYPCGVGISYLVVREQGGIAKCHMASDEFVGFVQDGDPFVQLRSASGGVQNPPAQAKEDCRECLWRLWCAGGCPLLTGQVFGRVDRASPNCRVYRTLIPEVLRLEGLRLLQYQMVLK